MRVTTTDIFVFKGSHRGGAWIAQSVKHPTAARVMISQFVGLSPRLGLCADSAEPAWDSLSPSFSVSLSLSR